MTEQGIFGSPARYIQGNGILDRIGEEIARLGPTGLLLVDSVVRNLVAERIERQCAAAGMQISTAVFQGEITREAIDGLAAQSHGLRPDVVVGAGGGKTIDAAKGLSRFFGSAMVSIPTSASNDAPTSGIFVLYDAQHRLASVEKLGRNPDLVVVDTDIIVRAPKMLFLAGIGDAIVKKFEVAQCIAAGGLNVYGGRPLEIAAVLADRCYDVVREDGEAALAAVDAGTATPAFERTTQATILLSGLAFENGGLSISHAMTRGLPAVSAAAAKFHGFQVAYALLVQLVLEERPPSFMEELTAFYKRIGLPRNLVEIGLGDASDSQLAEVAELTLKAPHARNFTHPLDRDRFVAAMRATAQF